MALVAGFCCCCCCCQTGRWPDTEGPVRRHSLCCLGDEAALVAGLAGRLAEERRNYSAGVAVVEEAGAGSLNTIRGHQQLEILFERTVPFGI